MVESGSWRFIIFLKFLWHLWLIVYVRRTHVPQYMWRCLRTANSSLFVPPTVWILSLELRLSGVMVASLPLSHPLDPHLFHFSYLGFFVHTVFPWHFISWVAFSLFFTPALTAWSHRYSFLRCPVFILSEWDCFRRICEPTAWEIFLVIESSVN